MYMIMNAYLWTSIFKFKNYLYLLTFVVSLIILLLIFKTCNKVLYDIDKLFAHPLNVDIHVVFIKTNALNMTWEACNYIPPLFDDDNQVLKTILEMFMLFCVEKILSKCKAPLKLYAPPKSMILWILEWVLW